MSGTVAQSSSSDGTAAALVVLLVLGTLAFAWIAGIAEIAGKREDEFATGTRMTWLLLVIFTGLLGLVAYVLVGKKRETARETAPLGHNVGWDSSKGMWACLEPRCGLTFDRQRDATLHRKLTRAAAPPAPAITNHDQGTAGHKVAYSTEEREYFCQTCDFTTVDRSAALEHKATGSIPTSRAEPTPPPPAPLMATPEFKTCPDCAEQIRFAARKCRFCGYTFESAGVSPGPEARSAL